MTRQATEEVEVEERDPAPHEERPESEELDVEAPNEGATGDNPEPDDEG